MNLAVINPIVHTDARLLSESDMGFLTTVDLKGDSEDELQDLEIDIREQRIYN